MAEANQKSKKEQEIEDNLAFFEEKLPDLIKDNRDRYVLLHNKSLVGIFDTARDAQTAGNKLYEDGIFSIQKVTYTVIDLGYFSHARGVV